MPASPPVPAAPIVAGITIALLALPGPSILAAGDPEPRPAALEFATSYSGQSWRNLSGGLRQGSTYLDNAEVSLLADGQRLLGIPGLELLASASYNNASTLSDTLVGDSMGVSNIDTDAGLRLYQAWADWRFPSGIVGSARVGLYDLNSEFDVAESRGLFLHATLGLGHELAQTGANGPSVFPVASFGVRLAVEPRDSVLLRTVVLDGAPGDPDDPMRPSLHFSHADGILWVSEVDTRPAPGTRLAVGYWQYSASFDDLAATDSSGSPRQRDDNRGGYLLAEFSPVDGGEWTAFMRGGIADGHVNEFDQYLSGGFVALAPWPRELDSLWGIAASAARAGDAYRAQQRALGRKMDTREWNVELTWRVQLDERLAIQPDLQYVVNPGCDASLRNALVAGLQVELGVAW